MSDENPLEGLIDDPNRVAKYMLKLLEETPGLEFQDIFYGDQTNIPRTPTICVEPGPMHSSLAGAPMVLENIMVIYVMVYHSMIQDTQVTKDQIGQLAYQVRTALHSDLTMGGLIIEGFVTDMEPGYSSRGNKLFNTSRITWAGQSRVMI